MKVEESLGIFVDPVSAFNDMVLMKMCVIIAVMNTTVVKVKPEKIQAQICDFHIFIYLALNNLKAPLCNRKLRTVL